MEQLVEALRYIREVHGFDSRWVHWNSGRNMALGSTKQLREMTTRNISQEKGGRCIRLTTLPHSCVDCPEIWEPHPPGTIRVCGGIALTLLPILRLNVEKDRMLLIHKSVKCLIYTTKKRDFQFYILRRLDAECLDKSRCIIPQCITETISRTCCAQVITSTIDRIQWTR